MATPDSFTVLMDLNNTGTASVDITKYVINVSAQMGITDPFGKVAATGSCTLTVNNPPDTLPFSPLGVTSPYYSNLLPKRAVSVLYYSYLSGWTVFTGFTKRFAPASGKNLEGNRFGVIECYDGMTVIQRAKIGTPLRFNVRGDLLVTTVLNTALNAASAQDTFTLNMNPANNDTITINGTKITFKTTLSGAANECLIGTRREDTANNLIALVNGNFGSGSTYGTGSTQPANVVASVNPELPTHATLWFDEAFPLNGSLTWGTNGNQLYNGYTYSGGSVGNSWSWSIFLQAGTYTFYTLGSMQNLCGQMTWYLDGVAFISAQDWYNASVLWNVVKSGAMTITQDGYHVITGTCTGVNPSAIAAYISVDKCWIKKATD